jgi:arylsulfatase A-like enzyme
MEDGMGWTRNWAPRVGALCALLCSACGGARGSVALANVEPKLEPAFGERPDAIPSDQPGVPDNTAHLNLQNIVHLADIDHHGLFIDFGTPARMKYTVGQWKTGWGADGVDGDTTYTVASSTVRVYFPLDSAAAFTLRFRLQPIGTTSMQPSLNNEALGTVRFDKGSGFAEYEVAVPARIARAGENQLVLHFGGSARVGDQDVAVAMDSIRAVRVARAADGGVVPETVSAALEALPVYGALVEQIVVDGEKRKAITVSAPTTLSFHVAVPKAGKLSVRVGTPDGSGSARVLLRVTPDAGKTTVLWKGLLNKAWEDHVLSLEPWAGSVVKLELSALGQGIVGFSSPTIFAPSAPSAAPTPARSVVLLLIDTMRADHLHPYNANTRVKTPALDRFAADATVFENTQAPESWTKPSVASVLTGLHPASHGAKVSDARLSESALTIGEVFKQAGFSTGTFIASGFISEKFGFNQGWDHYTNYMHEKRRGTAERVFRDAGNWIEAHKHERFFLYLQTVDPHVPYDPPPEFLNLYDPEPYAGPVRPRLTAELLAKAKEVPPKVVFDDRDRRRLEALYDGQVSYHDKYLGAFIERLKKLGLYEQVVFVVTADHGEEFYDHGSYGHGHSVYQELLGVPLMVHVPGAASSRVSDTVSTVDVSPTLLAAAGLQVPDVMEGENRMPQVLGALPHGPAVAFSDSFEDRRVIRAGRWKLILRGLTATLFDLQTDPHELREVEQRQHPIAMRYCRIMLGQFLGARDRGDWLTAVPKRKSVELKAEVADIDENTKTGLKALGYAN